MSHKSDCGDVGPIQALHARELASFLRKMSGKETPEPWREYVQTSGDEIDAIVSGWGVSEATACLMLILENQEILDAKLTWLQAAAYTNLDAEKIEMMMALLAKAPGTPPEIKQWKLRELQGKIPRKRYEKGR